MDGGKERSVPDTRDIQEINSESRGESDTHVRKRNISRMNLRFITCTIQQMVVQFIRRNPTAIPSLKREAFAFIINFRCDQFEGTVPSFFCLPLHLLYLPFTVLIICTNKQPYLLTSLQFSQWRLLAVDQKEEGREYSFLLFLPQLESLS